MIRGSRPTIHHIMAFLPFIHLVPVIRNKICLFLLCFSTLLNNHGALLIPLLLLALLLTFLLIPPSLPKWLILLDLARMLNHRSRTINERIPLLCPASTATAHLIQTGPLPPIPLKPFDITPHQVLQNALPLRLHQNEGVAQQLFG
jgi:hypothetical protein